MAESSLHITYDEVRREVAHRLSLTRDINNWTANDVQNIESCIRSGLRQFYSPPLLPGQRKAHAWFFLEPMQTLTTTVNVWQYDMPDGFAGLLSEVTFPAEESTYYTLKQTTESSIRRFRQGDQTYTSYPEYYAIVPKELGTNQLEGQRFEIQFWPTPQEAWELNYRCRLNPNMLDIRNKFHWGGMPHSETLLQSCLAVAEERVDDMEGISRKRFLENLASSIARDNDLRPRYYGYNNNGDHRWNNWDDYYYFRSDRGGQGHSYNGVSYGDG